MLCYAIYEWLKPMQVVQSRTSLGGYCKGAVTVPIKGQRRHLKVSEDFSRSKESTAGTSIGNGAPSAAVFLTEKTQTEKTQTENYVLETMKDYYGKTTMERENTSREDLDEIIDDWKQSMNECQVMRKVSIMCSAT